MIFCHKSAAQTGPDLHSAIKGTIVDATTQAVLPMVTITLAGRNGGSISDDQGAFVLEYLPAGTYTFDKLWSPRVSLAYAFSKNTFLRGAWGYYYQTRFINNLDVTTMLPASTLPSTRTCAIRWKCFRRPEMT